MKVEEMRSMLGVSPRKYQGGVLEIDVFLV